MEKLTAPAVPEWIVRMLPPGHVRYGVEVGKDRFMHVIESGEGYPVLMLHGNPTWGFLYRRIMSDLAGEGFRCIAPDLIGLGFSDKPAGMRIHTLENHAAWLGSLIDQLEISGLIFVGQDWGGPIGLRALSERPHLAKGVVLLNTAVGPPRPGFKPTFFHRLSRMPVISTILFRGLGFPQKALHKVQGDPASIRGAVAGAYRYPLRRVRDNAAPLALARMVPDSLDHPSVEPLKRCLAFAESFNGPVEIVWGKKDPILGRLLNRTKEALPRAGVTETEAGHFIQEEAPEKIADAIRRVRARIE